MTFDEWFKSHAAEAGYIEDIGPIEAAWNAAKADSAEEIERLRAQVNRLNADRTHELENCPYCRKHGDHAYSPCYLHGGCAEAAVNVLDDGMFEFTCPTCGVESDKVRRQHKEIERLRAENDALRQTLHDELDGNLRLRALGGARDDEPFPTFIERVISERAAVKSLLREAADAADDVGVKHFDTDWLSDEVQRLKNITLRIRAALGDSE